ncbi:MAG: hypothetical protein ACRDG3_08745, partial [Tepidiformaceae bacterium]
MSWPMHGVAGGVGVGLRGGAEFVGVAVGGTVDGGSVGCGVGVEVAGGGVGVAVAVFVAFAPTCAEEVLEMPVPGDPAGAGVRP